MGLHGLRLIEFGATTAVALAVAGGICVSSAAVAGDRSMAGRPSTTIAHPEADCVGRGDAVWVSAGGRPDCIRFTLSTVGGARSDAIVELSSDDSADEAAAARMSPLAGGNQPAVSDARRVADAFSNALDGPAFVVTRPVSAVRATAQSTTKRDVELIAAALDAIKQRFALVRLHVVGSGSGGTLAAAMVERRDDIGCAVIGAASLAEKQRLRAQRFTVGPAQSKQLYDPLDLVRSIMPRRDLRVFVAYDPADRGLPRDAVEPYLRAARAQGLPLRAVRMVAVGPGRDGLAKRTHAAIMACARGAGDSDVEAALKDRPSDPAVAGNTAARVAIVTSVERSHPLAGRLAFDALTMESDPIKTGSTETLGARTKLTRKEKVALKTAPPRPPVEAADMRPFSIDDLLDGKTADRGACDRLATAVWVEGRNGPECIRYYYSQSGGRRPNALVYFPGDMVRGGSDTTRAAPRAGYEWEAPATFQTIANAMSASARGPFLILARPGSIGSSGNELRDRRSLREVEIVSLALDEIRRRHNLEGFDLVGHSGGGQLVAAMMTVRNDIGCAVMASPAVAEKLRHRLLGIKLSADLIDRIYDPIDHVAEIADRPELRIFVVNDDDDRVVPAASIEPYLNALGERGLRYDHLLAKADDEDRHDVALHGLRAAVACALGQPNMVVKSVVDATVVTHPTMSEIGAARSMRDMPRTFAAKPATGNQ